MGLLYDITLENKIVKIIGVFTVSNTLSICIHDIDQEDEQVLATANGENPKWYPIMEQLNEDTDKWEQGFMFGSFFVPFSEVIRI